MGILTPMKASTSHKRGRAVRIAAALVGLGLSLGGCMHDEPIISSLKEGIPGDYRLRLPIAVEEANQ